jgi:hypothetical protein
LMVPLGRTEVVVATVMVRLAAGGVQGPLPYRSRAARCNGRCTTGGDGRAMANRVKRLQFCTTLPAPLSTCTTPLLR